MKNIQNFSQGKISKQLIMFALPILFGNIFQQLYNIVDTAIAGHLLGDAALSAIGATSSINSLVLTVSFGLNGGFGIIIAQTFGRKDYDKLRTAFAKAITFNIIISLIIAVGSFIVIKPVMRLINTPLQDFDSAYSYIIVLLCCVFVTMFYNLEATVLRSLGDSKTPLYFIMLSTVVNIVLDYVFIAKFSFGVAGAAIATVIAQGLASILCAIVIIKNFKILKIRKEDLKPDKALSRSMLSAGLAMALMNSIFSIGSIILQSAINSLGSQIIAANLASRKISEVFMQPLITMGLSTSTFISQNYGAQKPDRIKETLKWGTIYSVMWSVFTVIIIFTIGGMLINLITGTQEDVIRDNALFYLKINVPFYFVLGILFNLRFSIQSIGSKVPPLISSSIELVTKVVAAYLFIPLMGYLGACVAEPISWLLGGSYLIFAFKSSFRKMRIRLESHNDSAINN